MDGANDPKFCCNYGVLNLCESIFQNSNSWPNESRKLDEGRMRGSFAVCGVVMICCEESCLKISCGKKQSHFEHEKINFRVFMKKRRLLMQNAGFTNKNLKISEVKVLNFCNACKVRCSNIPFLSFKNI